MKKRLLSWIKPSGTIHLGNYFGAIKQFVLLQDEYDSFIFIADFHALTTVLDKDTLAKNTLNIAMDYLACGLDPKKVCLFKQSDTPQVAELTWYFNCITTMPYLERATAYKDATAKGKEANVGLFDYPILMAADILIQDADIVPVGADQKQHIEYARDTAQKFNNIFGQTFKMPEAMIIENSSVVPGIDGRKMSKSYNNIIPLFGTDKEIKKVVMSIVTNSQTSEEPKDPDKCNIFALHKLFLNDNDISKLRERYLAGGLSYKESKEMLLSEILDFIKPMRERRKFYEENPKEVLKILEEGKMKAGTLAQEKINFIRNKIGINI
ncbi:MAG: tryptophan--tRNA ligase [Candidatus Pacebacteria bacterium]|nr:tryptophan--tRNA ligase [Candidatus Paceibacterota bacterium]